MSSGTFDISSLQISAKREKFSENRLRDYKHDQRPEYYGCGLNKDVKKVTAVIDESYAYSIYFLIMKEKN